MLEAIAGRAGPITATPAAATKNCRLVTDHMTLKP